MSAVFLIMCEIAGGTELIKERCQLASCRAHTTRVCSRCRAASYCSPEHEEQHSRSHRRRECAFFEKIKRGVEKMKH